MGNSSQRIRRRASEDDCSDPSAAMTAYSYLHGGRVPTPKKSRRSFSLSRGGGREGRGGRERSHTVAGGLVVGPSPSTAQFSPSTARKIEAALARVPLRSASPSYGAGSGVVRRSYAKKASGGGGARGKRPPLPRFGSLPDFDHDSNVLLESGTVTGAPSANTVYAPFGSPASVASSGCDGGYESHQQHTMTRTRRARTQVSFPPGSLSRSRSSSHAPQPFAATKQSYNRAPHKFVSTVPEFSSPVGSELGFSSQASSVECLSPDASSPSFVDDEDTGSSPRKFMRRPYNRKFRARPAPPPSKKSKSVMVSPSLTQDESTRRPQVAEGGRSRSRSSQTTLQKLKSARAFYSSKRFRSRSPIKISYPVSSTKKSDVVINIGASPKKNVAKKNVAALQRSTTTKVAGASISTSTARPAPAAPFSNPTSTRKWNGEKIVAFERLNNELKVKLRAVTASTSNTAAGVRAPPAPMTRPTSASAAAGASAYPAASTAAGARNSHARFASASAAAESDVAARTHHTMPRLRVRPPPPPRSNEPSKPAAHAAAGVYVRPVSSVEQIRHKYEMPTVRLAHSSSRNNSLSHQKASAAATAAPGAVRQAFSAPNTPIAATSRSAAAPRHSTSTVVPSSGANANNTRSNSSYAPSSSSTASRGSRGSSRRSITLSRSRRPRAPTPAMFQAAEAAIASGANVLGHDGEVTLQIGAHDMPPQSVVAQNNSTLRRSATPVVVVEPSSLTAMPAPSSSRRGSEAHQQQCQRTTRARSFSDAAPAAPVNGSVGAAKEYKHIPVPNFPAPPHPQQQQQPQQQVVPAPSAFAQQNDDAYSHTNSTRARATSAYTTTSSVSKPVPYSQSRPRSRASSTVSSHSHRRTNSLSNTHNTMCADPTLAPYWPSESTLRAPPMQKLLRGFSVLIWDQITLNTQAAQEGAGSRGGGMKESEMCEEDMLDDDMDMDEGAEEYSGAFVKVTQWQKGDIPSFREIHRYVCALYKKSRPSWECVILAGVFVHRLVLAGQAPVITRDNWVSVVFTANMLSQKYQDDECWKNVDFANYPVRIYTDTQVNAMEAHFLDVLRWDCYVSLNEYKKYFTSLLYFADAGAPKANAARQQRA